MAKLIIDDALLREPNLWIPGKKPVGPVKIDWSHPLTDGLTDFWMATNGGLIDLVQNRVVASGNITVGKGRQVWETPTNDNTLTLNAGAIILSNFPHFSYLQSWVHSQANWAEIGAITTGSNSLGAAKKNNAYLYLTNADTGVAYTPYAAGDPFTCVSSADFSNLSSAPTSFYIDGKFIATLTNTRGYSITLNGPKFDTGSQASVNAFWTRTFTSEQSISLTLDPYQFLIPA